MLTYTNAAEHIRGTAGLNVLDDILGKIAKGMLVVEARIFFFLMGSWDISSRVCGDKISWFSM